MHRLMHLAAAIPWAISPTWLSTILTIANREGPGPEAVAKELGRPLENTRAVEMRGSVAVIPVHGPIFRRANVLSEVSGATSVQVLATDLHLALDTEDVSAIVLDIDSPGGEANGISELAAMIYASRGRKPIHAYVGGTGASAAYWIAAACDRIHVGDTASVGSIGVVRAVPNPGASSAKDIEIVSSQSPNKRPDVTTEDGRAVYQTEVDELASVFVSRVAAYRGVSVETVLGRFGKGACLVGASAVAAGMADDLMSFEAVLASLSTSPTSAPMGAQASHPTASAPAPETTMSLPSKPRVRTLAAEDEDMPKTDDVPAVEPDGDEPAAPAFEVGDEVMVGDRSATVTEVRNGPHYAVEFSDDGSAFKWASEDELGSAGGEDAPAAEEDEDEDPKVRALSMKVRALQAQLLGSKRAEKRGAVDALLATARNERRVTPALVAALAAAAPTMRLEHFRAIVTALPKIGPIASVRNPPPAPKQPSSPVDLSFNGKKYADLSWSEREQLHATNKDLFDAMRMAHESEKNAPKPG
jgi:ClpP class serine protease